MKNSTKHFTNCDRFQQTCLGKYADFHCDFWRHKQFLEQALSSSPFKPFINPKLRISCLIC